MKDNLMCLPSLCHYKSFQTMVNIYSNERDNNQTCIMHVISLPALLNMPILYLKTMSLYCLMYNSMLLSMNKLIYFLYMISIYNVNINIQYLINSYAKIYIDLYFDKFQRQLDHTNFLKLNTITCT